MHRIAIPFVVAAAVSLACPEAFAGSGLPVRTVMASWSTQDQPEAEAEAEADLAAEAEPEPEPTYEAAPAPQPYADPSATGVAPGPQPGVAAPPPMPRKRRKGLMIAGWSMFGGSYLFTALVAGIVHDSCDLADRPNCRRAAGFALVPLVGPFLTIPYLNTTAIMPKVFMALPGLVQIAGLAMGIAGTIQFVSDGKEPRYVGADGFKLGPKLRLGMAPTRFLDGGTLTLGARF